MWTSLGRVPAASGRDQPNQCTSFRRHLPAAEGIGALLWFIRAPFWAPFNSAYQIKQKNVKHPSCEQSLLYSSAFSTYSFQYHGKICRSISPCWNSWFGRTTYLNQRYHKCQSSGYHFKMLFNCGNTYAWPKEEREGSTLTSISTCTPDSF